MTALSVRVPAGLVALAAVLVLALGAVACGSDDDGGDDNAAAQGATTGSEPASGGGKDEQQVEALFADMRKAIADSDAQALCDLSTEQAKAQITQSTKNGGSCEKVMTKVFAGGQVSEDLEPKYLGAEIEDGRAVVKAKQSTSPKPVTASFVKEDGAWKVNLWLTD